MTQLCRLAALASALALLACPASALAQGDGGNQGEGENPPPLNDQPPSSLEGGENGQSGRDGAESGSAQNAPPAPATEPQLAATGSDTWLVALAGAGLVLTGVGLRLRLTPHTSGAS